MAMHTYGGVWFDDVTGDVWENEPECEEDEELDDDFEDEFEGEDDGEIVDVTAKVRGLFGKGEGNGV